MNNLKEKLEELDKWYRDNDMDLYQQLNPGIDTATMQDVECKLSLKIPDDLKMLLEWHNGTTDEYLDIGLGAPFNSLEISLIELDTCTEAIGEEWNQRWLPIFGEGDEQWFIILSKENSKSSGIYKYNFDDENIYLQYENIDGLVSTVLAACNSGLIKPLSDRTDDFYELFFSDEFETIRKNNNPTAYPFSKQQGMSVIPSAEDEWPDDWKL